MVHAWYVRAACMACACLRLLLARAADLHARRHRCLQACRGRAARGCVARQHGQARRPGSGRAGPPTRLEAPSRVRTAALVGSRAKLELLGPRSSALTSLRGVTQTRRVVDHPGPKTRSRRARAPPRRWQPSWPLPLPWHAYPPTSLRGARWWLRCGSSRVRRSHRWSWRGARTTRRRCSARCLPRRSARCSRRPRCCVPCTAGLRRKLGASGGGSALMDRLAFPRGLGRANSFQSTAEATP